MNAIGIQKFYVKWSKAVGVLLIVFGGLICLTLVGALVGVPLIFSGRHLMNSGKAMEDIVRNQGEVLEISPEEEKILMFFYRFGRYLKVSFVFSMVLVVLSMIIFFVVFFNVIGVFLSGDLTSIPKGGYYGF